MNSDLFLFSTSATSSSVENCPLTTMMSCLMASSLQSTSNNPPMTTGSLAGFTYNRNSVVQKFMHINLEQHIFIIQRDMFVHKQSAVSFRITGLSEELFL